jgi:hypothetical protein
MTRFRFFLNLPFSIFKVEGWLQKEDPLVMENGGTNKFWTSWCVVLNDEIIWHGQSIFVIHQKHINAPLFGFQLFPQPEKKEKNGTMMNWLVIQPRYFLLLFFMAFEHRSTKFWLQFLPTARETRDEWHYVAFTRQWQPFQQHTLESKT